MKIDRHHWRHYFGGVALLLLLFQFISGVYLTLFYQPHLNEAYASVQYLYKTLGGFAWIRDSHRWMAFLLIAAIVVHTVRSLLRKDFLDTRRKTVWLAGSLLLLPLMAMLATGFILPWEWRGYWFMEMMPNYLGDIPIIGPGLKHHLIESFSLSRNFIAHVVILPAISIILIDIHILAKARRRLGGIPPYLLRYGLISLPFLAIVVALAFAIPTPTEDPEMIPMPLEGTNIPVPEWFILILMVPYMYFEGAMGPVLGLLLPFVLFLLLTFLPYFFKRRPVARPIDGARKAGLAALVISVASVVIVCAGLFGGLYAGTHVSPTLGCNSCHNVSMGARMGVPPAAFKDRNVIPNNGNNKWMVEHWFYPQVVW
ncbi:MAG: cytochrome b N-terminal domain-containing protein [Alphaproteobacteria bacterium]|jgi:ubiquinol-cytochrome c reductase cytochrome b subunit|nr:cytochrome b N-terminal domain-containing protein [Alphaproteobacteria bacterium]|tara:strand:+ start:66 stop:1175 length:1110 start_codon:yes stop_codon:yes gene_type:complete